MMHSEFKVVTQDELDALERFLDRIWATLGIDVGFSRHFVDRVNDERNKKPITIADLKKIYTDTYEKLGKKIMALGRSLNKRPGEIEAILTQLSTNLNIPFVIRWNPRKEMLDFHGITIMRKPNFRPNKPGEKHFKIEGQVMFSNTPKSLVEAVKGVRQKSDLQNAVYETVIHDVFGVTSFKQLTSEQKGEFEAVMEFVKTLDEQTIVTELSKKTLGSYIKNAAHSASIEKVAAFANYRAGRKKLGNTGERIVKNRFTGIERAVNKMQKESAPSYDDDDRRSDSRSRTDDESERQEREKRQKDPRYKTRTSGEPRYTDEEAEPVTELSKKTLGSYIKKATDSVHFNADNAGWNAAKGNHGRAVKDAEKTRKRVAGISQAVDKISKPDKPDKGARSSTAWKGFQEETEISEDIFSQEELDAIQKHLNEETINEARSLSDIAREIRRDWKPVNYAARPYLDAMASLDSINDTYGADSGKSVVLYFLSNASSWRGETAKRVKAELKAMASGKAPKNEETVVEGEKENKSILNKTLKMSKEHPVKVIARRILRQKPTADV